MKKRVLSIMLCMGMTMTLFAGCGSADQKQADHTEAVQETSTLSKLMDKDSTEEATEAAEVTETTESTEASETADPTASADTSSETVLETSASGNDAAASGTAKADTKNKKANQIPDQRVRRAQASLQHPQEVQKQTLHHRLQRQHRLSKHPVRSQRLSQRSQQPMSIIGNNM